MEINVTLPDGKIRRYPSGTTIEQVAESIRTGLKKNASEELWNQAEHSLKNVADFGELYRLCLSSEEST